ncbi:hypothetical protein MPSEU_000835600 [Mayamaea pseudoterrestris]|nr:hypothetical protein MPSEU_000835600 [Mayamaea pseudoterrestris]
MNRQKHGQAKIPLEDDFQEEFCCVSFDEEHTKRLLAGHRNKDHQYKSRYGFHSRIYKRIFAATALGVVLHVSSKHHHSWKKSTGSKFAAPNDETLPTLLNVLLPSINIDELDFQDSSIYVNALNNPLYDRLERAEWRVDRSDEALRFALGWVLEPCEISIDRTSIAAYEPLTVSWSTGTMHAATASGERSRNIISVVTEESIMILSCSDDANDYSRAGSSLEVLNASRKQIQDAAMIQQAKKTSRYHLRLAARTKRSLLGDDENVWFIPSFPVIRHKYCQFKLYQSIITTKADTEQEVLAPIAESPRFTIDSLNKPLSIHLALALEPSQMVVNFVTGTAIECRQNTSLAIVEYGLVSSSISFRQFGTTTTYTASDMCQAPANVTAPGKFRPPGCLHSVTMDGLEPNAQYWYKVGVQQEHEDGVVDWSDVYEFTSAPTVGSSGNKHGYVDEALDDAEFEPFAFIAYGDQGCPATGWTKGAAWVARMVEAELNYNATPTRPAVRMVHHIGDLSYAEGAAHIWDEWQHMIEPITARVPYMVGVGNHEYDHKNGGTGKDPSGVTTDGGFQPDWGNFGDDSRGECGVPTAKRFTMPKSDTSNGVFWYSFDFANVHTIMISSEHALYPGTPQYTWLEHDLLTVNRLKTPWLILETHRPMYTPDNIWKRDKVSVGMRREFEMLLKQYKVDLVLAGHMHSYHRSCDGLYEETCNNGGSTYVTVGSAGARFQPVISRHNSWTAKSIQRQFGYGRITVMNASALHFEFVKVGKTDEDSGAVGDDFWLYREHDSVSEDC